MKSIITIATPASAKGIRRAKYLLLHFLHWELPNISLKPYLQVLQRRPCMTIGSTLLIRIVQIDMDFLFSAVVEGALWVSNIAFKTFLTVRCIHPKAHSTSS